MALPRLLGRFRPGAQVPASALRPALSVPEGLSALPPGTDWAWRAPVFTRALTPGTAPARRHGDRPGPGLTLWHDLPGDSVTLDQVASQGGPPAHGLQLVCTAPPGAGYVALSLDLPEAVLDGLDTGFILLARLVIGADAPPDLYLRLNIEHGPNVEQLLRHLDTAGAGGVGAGATGVIEIGFDLGFVEMNPNRLAKIWLDVIAEKPGTNRVRLHDLVASRHRRADM